MSTASQPQEPKKRGGARHGAGRPKGTGKGRTVKTVAISVTVAALPKFRMAAYRAGLSLSAWLSAAGESAIKINNNPKQSTD